MYNFFKVLLFIVLGTNIQIFIINSYEKVGIYYIPTRIKVISTIIIIIYQLITYFYFMKYEVRNNITFKILFASIMILIVTIIIDFNPIFKSNEKVYSSFSIIKVNLNSFIYMIGLFLSLVNIYFYESK